MGAFSITRGGRDDEAPAAPETRAAAAVGRWHLVRIGRRPEGEFYPGAAAKNATVFRVPGFGGRPYA
jgi:hypothetical protein